MKRLHAMLLVPAFLALGAGAATAQEEEPRPEQPMRMRMHQGAHGMGQGMGRGMMEMMPGMARIHAFTPGVLLQRKDALELTDEQVSRLEAIGDRVQTAHQQAMEQAKPHQEQLAEAWKADAPDVNALRQHATAAMQAHQTAHLAMLQAAAEAKAVLTAEQRGRVAGWADARVGMMQHRRPGLMMRRPGIMRQRPDSTPGRNR